MPVGGGGKNSNMNIDNGYSVAKQLINILAAR